MENRKLEGKVAIVTGAGSSGPGMGTGKAMSLLFAREGAKVVLVDMFEDRAQETLSLIEAEGGMAGIVLADLSDVSQAPRVIDDAAAMFDGVDILVNNAALTSPFGLLDTTTEYLQKVITINLTAPIQL
jgi:NAD(P)-dependent dehydrogenase (short-subunit alcohol dehydrogenase family)